eukprot:2551135-Pleurochrysis_carterae.AAC.2
MEPQRTSTAMLEGKDMVALSVCSPTRCAARARTAAERSDASRADAKGAASTNSPRSFRA